MKWLFISLFFTSSCSHTLNLEEKMNTHIVKTSAYWKKYQNLSFEKKMLSAPSEVLEYISLDNEKSGFKERPTRAILDSAFLRDFKAAIDELPLAVKKQMKRYLLAILFVNNLAGSGYAETVVDNTQKDILSFIVFDYGMLKNMSANKWATWKENSPFHTNNKFVSLKIADKNDDNRKNALKFILLHELGHVFAPNWRVHPPVMFSKENSNVDCAFFSLSWKLNDEHNSYQTIYDNIKPYSQKLSFYKNTIDDNKEQRLMLYQQLQKSNFPSLYSVTHFADDFAESFAIYIYTQILKMPYELTLFDDSKIKHRFLSCIQEKRCPEKNRIIRELLR